MNSFTDIIGRVTGAAAGPEQWGGQPYWGWGHHMMGDWGFGAMGWLGPIMMLVFWGSIILVLVLLARRLWYPAQHGAGTAPVESPLEVLKRRYAEGDIGRDEFERMKKDLLA